jgi:hypothetical protein
MHVRYPHKQVRKTADPRNAEVYNPADVTKSRIFLKQVAVIGVFSATGLPKSFFPGEFGRRG